MTHRPDRHLQRDRHWPAVLKIIGGFSSQHLKQALLLHHNLALQCADNGQPQRLLARRWDFPLFDLHGWLLGDWDLDDPPTCAVFEKDLFLAATFTFLSCGTRSSRLDPHSFFDASYESLELELSRQADLHWKRLFPETSLFWSHHRRAHDAAFPAAEPTDPLAATGHWAYASLPAVATALWAGKEASIPSLCSYADHCREVLQIVDHLATYRRDLTNGRVTYPFRRALDVMRLTDSSTIRVETALGALLLTGTLDKILKECRVRIAAARAIALALPTLQAYCDELDELLLQIRGLFGLKLGSDTVARPAMPGFTVPAPDVLQNVLLKAEAYLLEDRSFREAWDVQQHSFTSAQRIVGRVFTASMIVDMLAAHGHDMSAAAKELLETVQSQGFRYWDHTHLLAPDADTVALALRLVPLARYPERYRRALQTPLRWLRDNQLPSGQIPVWLLKHDSPPALSELAVLYGASCATVEANLLLSLIGVDWHGQRDLVESCARQWCQRWLAVGLGACEHYTPLYSLWAATELVAQLKAHTADAALQAQLQQVALCVRERLQVEAGRTDLSPQDAAFLILASLRTQALCFDARWVTILFKHQRHDGCWEGEPLYVTPSARNLTTQWFKSRALTTAFIYHALKHHHASLQARD